MTVAQRKRNREYQRVCRKRRKTGAKPASKISAPAAAPEVFNLARELSLAKLEAFRTLLRVMRTGSGIASMTAALKIREWADEEDDQLEPFEIVDANPFEVKPVQIREAN